MLKYLYEVTEDLLPVVTLVTLLYVTQERLYGRWGRISQNIGIVAGLIASAVMAAIRQTTTMLTQTASYWNFYSYFGTFIFALLFLLFSLLSTGFFTRLDKKNEEKVNALDQLSCVFGAGLSTLMIFGKCREDMRKPFNFNTMGNGTLSSDYFIRLSGFALALVLLLLFSILLAKCARNYRKAHLPYAITVLSALTVLVQFTGLSISSLTSVMFTRKIGFPITFSSAKYPHLYKFAIGTYNSSLVFTLILMALALLLIVLFYRENTKIVDPYDNSAQLRKLKAKNRRHRRYAAAFLVCMALSIVTITAVKAEATKAVELSAPETYTVDGERILVSLDQLSDGNLHRFEYEVGKTKVRWIVIKKPNSAAYGVGLDACDVCGNAGYYQRGDQVVCKRCDVVMNINTIGFMGGCNPIPLNYSIDNGYMAFELADIEAGAKEFK